MIHDPARLREVIEEISAWSLQARREYIASMEKAFGPKSAQQLRDGLMELWRRKSGPEISQ
jgi:hypothetical protein